MKTLNAKRIAAVVAGAALLGVGLAFAGPITFQNVPIISNSGQPVVQIVIGSNAKPQDGVTAANIAAAIGNLAYTSVPVTASVNQTQAAKVLGVSLSSSSYTLSNQQVWLNESGSVSAGSGTYLFGALIGSVLNGAVVLGTPQNTKSLQGAGQYSFPQTHSIQASPNPTPYYVAGQPPSPTTVTASNNGGGVSFTLGFQQGNANDNILQLTSAQLPSLLSNFGGYGESSYLWLTGFPVYDQGTSGAYVNQFQLLDAGGAYQAIFNTPIQNSTSSSGRSINAQIRLLDTNYTILSATGAGLNKALTSANTLAGGQLRLASSLVPLTTVYVGHNLTTGPWTVQLTDLGQPNSNGVSPASLSILYNNVVTNTSSVSPGVTTKFNVTGHTLYVNVNQTFAGLYAYQKWAKIQLYTNVFNVTNGKVFNQTLDPGWYADLLWTNTTVSSGTSNAVALQSIILYNTSPTNLAPGQSFTFIQNPQKYKVTFLGDTLGASSFDTVSLATQSSGAVQYQNLGTAISPQLGIKNITEPVQELLLTSQIPSAFSYSGQTGSSVLYDLTPYELNEAGNSINLGTVASGNEVSNSVITLAYTNVNAANWITSTYPLTIQVTGFTSNAATTATTQQLQFTAPTGTFSLPSIFFNVTAITIQGSRALPGATAITVNSPSLETGSTANTVQLAQLVSSGSPGVMYTPSSTSQYQYALSLTAAGNVIYNQQNGQTTNTFVLAQSAPPEGPALGQYFTFTAGEVAVPSNTAAVDGFVVGIDNSTAGVGTAQEFQLNYSKASSATATGSKNNVTYLPSSLGTAITVIAPFRSEKGSQVVSITPTLVTFAFAKAQDLLQFQVGLANSTTTGKNFKLYGPYGIGQATNIANVSIGPVTANIAISGNSVYTVTGINNLTAIPSVSSATQPVLLRNLTTTPLVVLDSQANSGSNLILIGSGFVNSLSGQLQTAYNISVTPTTQLTQAYGTNRILVAGYYANQTGAAGNSFIQQLYAQAT